MQKAAIICLIAIVALATITDANELHGRNPPIGEGAQVVRGRRATNVRTSPCDEVCHRTNPEQESCCKAHGFSTGRCKNFESFCDN